MATPIYGASLRPNGLSKPFAHVKSIASKRNFSHTPTLNATLIRRPKRPYTFTQLVTLSDGSSFIHRTTSPTPVYKSNKDMRNSAMWNPTSQKLLNVEEDEAGRLRAFRERFGRGWDSESVISEEDTGTKAEHESLIDLISGFGGAEQVKHSSNARVAKPGKKAKK